MQVRDIMSHPVITCPAASTLDQVARLMWEFDCGIIPVVDDGGKLAGVVTDRDVCMGAYTQGRPLGEIPVRSVMATQVVAVHGDDTVDAAEALMQESQVRRLPVIDRDGRPAGVVSLNDLARLAARARKAAVDRELVRTLAAVCQPRATSVPVAQLETVRHAGAG